MTRGHREKRARKAVQQTDTGKMGEEVRQGHRNKDRWTDGQTGTGKHTHTHTAETEKRQGHREKKEEAKLRPATDSLSSMCGQGQEEQCDRGSGGRRQNTVGQDVRADISDDEESPPQTSPSAKGAGPEVRSPGQTFPAHVLPLQENALADPQGHACLVTGPSPSQEGHSIC